jgi:hypothetical protein
MRVRAAGKEQQPQHVLFCQGVGFCAMGGVDLAMWPYSGLGQAVFTQLWMKVCSCQYRACRVGYAACYTRTQLHAVQPHCQPCSSFDDSRVWHFRRYHLASCFLRSRPCLFVALSCCLHAKTCTLHAKCVADYMLGPPAFLFTEWTVCVGRH